VGVSAGGGYDTYARAISRHIGKYIPGHPAIIVENMPGAGCLVCANYLYRVAKPDGLTMGSFFGSLAMAQVFKQQGIEFDMRKFEYIGGPAQDTGTCILSKASGITSIDKWMASKTPVKMGGVALGSHTPDNLTRIVKTVLGFPVQHVSGYKGTAEIRLAVESGELAGVALGWESARITWRRALDAGDVIVLLQATPKPLPELPNVPLVISLARTEEERHLIQTGIHDPTLIARPYALPPGTPKERVQILRKAFQETLKDKEFLAEAEKAKLFIDPVSGQELEKTIAGLFKLDPAFLTKLKDIYYK